MVVYQIGILSILEAPDGGIKTGGCGATHQSCPCDSGKAIDRAGSGGLHIGAAHRTGIFANADAGFRLAAIHLVIGNYIAAFYHASRTI